MYIQSLCEALATLPHLVSLDVHSNLLTASGLSKLAEALRGDSITGLKVLATGPQYFILLILNCHFWKFIYSEITKARFELQSARRWSVVSIDYLPPTHNSSLFTETGLVRPHRRFSWQSYSAGTQTEAAGRNQHRIERLVFHHHPNLALGRPRFQLPQAAFFDRVHSGELGGRIIPCGHHPVDG